MRVFIASEFRCTVYNGEYYLASKAYTIYKRYAENFGEVVLCSRFVKTEKINDGYHRAYFIKETLPITNLSNVLTGLYDTKIRKLLLSCNLVIVRVPSIIAYSAAEIAISNGVTLLAEAMADPWDAYWNHGIKGKLIAPYMTFKMKSVMSRANYAVYVTKEYLQKMYPCKGLNISASNVDLEKLEEVILKKRLQKISETSKKNISLMTAAGINVKAKGHRYVIEAIRKLKEKNIRVEYYLAGEGSSKYLKGIAKEFGVEDNVIFLGELPMQKVYEYMDIIDIYIQPSLQEGLPRAVIEAMSRACPCLGARTAGIPELLDEECVFERKSSDAIVSAVTRMLEDDMSKYARNNFERSKEYYNDVLDQRRNSFFEQIKRDINKKGLK